jgi:hypothetical protein
LPADGFGNVLDDPQGVDNLLRSNDFDGGLVDQAFALAESPFADDN